MASGNAAVASHLRRFAALLTLEGADRFKIKAYRRAADNLETLDADLGQMVARGEDLRTIPGVGRAISETIREIIQTGSMPQLESRLSQISPELVELTTRPRLDPRKVARVYKKLGIGSLAELRKKLESGVIRDAFGTRLAFHIREGLDERPRMLLETAEDMADRIEAFLTSRPGVTRVARVGSLRRKQETVGDLNFLIAARDPAQVYRRFSSFGGINKAPGARKPGAFTLSSGLGVTLVCAPPAHWGLASILHTGSGKHIGDLQSHAAGRDLNLTVASLQRKDGKLDDERAVYRRLGLDYVEPELREGRSEVQAAAAGRLPKLVSLDDIRGDLHMHTTASDGTNSIVEMAKAAHARGYEYIAITDHSQSLKITNGLSEKRLLAHIKQIDAINARLKGIRVLKSAEVDILEDGSLDYSDAVLKELDFTICSIHSRFGLNGRQQTDRIRRAMDNRYFTILGHATGRLLLKREGYEVDMDRLFEHAKCTGCYFEINSSPDRLDLSDENALRAKLVGLRIAINTDAHSIAELDFMSAGINQARRGWLEPQDVLNTLPLAKLLRALRR